MYIPFIVELYVVCDPRLHEICALPHVLPPEYCDASSEAKGVGAFGSSHVFVHEAKHAVTFKGPGAALRFCGISLLRYGQNVTVHASMNSPLPDLGPCCFVVTHLSLIHI